MLATLLFMICSKQQICRSVFVFEIQDYNIFGWHALLSLPKTANFKYLCQRKLSYNKQLFSCKSFLVNLLITTATTLHTADNLEKRFRRL